MGGEYDGDKAACFAWQASACQFKVESISHITFHFDFLYCHAVWACPLWITPNPWCGPTMNNCRQGYSGEMDFIEMCNGREAQSSFGCYDAPGESHCKDGAWA